MSGGWEGRSRGAARPRENQRTLVAPQHGDPAGSSAAKGHSTPSEMARPRLASLTKELITSEVQDPEQRLEWPGGSTHGMSGEVCGKPGKGAQLPQNQPLSTELTRRYRPGLCQNPQRTPPSPRLGVVIFGKQ